MRMPFEPLSQSHYTVSGHTALWADNNRQHDAPQDSIKKETKGKSMSNNQTVDFSSVRNLNSHWTVTTSVTTEHLPTINLKITKANNVAKCGVGYFTTPLAPWSSPSSVKTPQNYKMTVFSRQNLREEFNGLVESISKVACLLEPITHLRFLPKCMTALWGKRDLNSFLNPSNRLIATWLFQPPVPQDD